MEQFDPVAPSYKTAPTRLIIINRRTRRHSATMLKLAATLTTLVVFVSASPRTSEELIETVTQNCGDMGCVKENVLEYLDNVLGIQSDARSIKNIDAAIYKRVARVLQTREFRMKLPEVLFGQSEAIYNPQSGFDVATVENENESRGLLLKKKLLLPFLLLFKLKMKLLMPIFVAIIGLKATKALILSKLAILIVLGFVAYQLLGKAGMPMPLMMPPAPAEPPSPMYGPPPPSPAPPSSYDPSWEPNTGGPYSRVWSGSDEPQRMAYSAYYPGPSSNMASSTTRP